MREFFKQLLKALLDEQFSEAPIREEVRSPGWREVAKSHLEIQPYCAVCGWKKDLNVHHILPFHLHPELELEPSNLITLGVKCPTGNHHLLFGHFGNWTKFNPSVQEDAAKFLVGFKSAKVV